MPERARCSRLVIPRPFNKPLPLSPLYKECQKIIFSVQKVLIAQKCYVISTGSSPRLLLIIYFNGKSFDFWDQLPIAMSLINLLRLTPGELEEFRDRYDAYFFDIDGCLFELSGKPFEGVEEAINEIIKNGKTVNVFTDNCTSTFENISSRINRLFPAIKKEHVMTTGRLLGKYLREISFREKIYVLGIETGIVKELMDLGYEVLHDEELRKLNPGEWRNIKLEEGVGAVVVATDINFNYTKLLKAAKYLADPRVLLIQTHYPEVLALDSLVLPVAGSLMAAVKAASGRKDSISSGKGGECSIKYLKSLGYEMERCLFVGDGLDNDIRVGNLCGMDTLLVLSGTSDLEDVQKARESNLETFIPTYYTNSVSDLIRVFKPDE